MFIYYRRGESPEKHRVRTLLVPSNDVHAYLQKKSFRIPHLSLSDAVHLGRVVPLSCQHLGVRVVAKVLHTWVVDHGRLHREAAT